MKLLIDENLPPSLSWRLTDLFPALDHVRDLGLQGRSDEELRQFALANAYDAIFTADLDFQKAVLAQAASPKIIRIERCNFSTLEIANLLRREAIRIYDFLASTSSLLLLRK